ncbi:hypothetical protein POTOM_029447 [Populus tomentosa]|uniref:Uncharacterized protein n=1 Tax=Populus tomentosa TaxID=118781 RepID=A0A8X7ZB04_POPTO|nr:hypothetical protein POTOM_029447 [Populus tomentosa]
MEMFQSLKPVSKSIFKDLLARIHPGVNCNTGDGNMGFVVDVAGEFHIFVQLVLAASGLISLCLKSLKLVNFLLETIADGLPVDHPRSGGQLMELFDAMKLVTKPIFKKILLETKPPVNCIIGDGILGFVGNVAIEVGVPIIYFRTVSACSFWAYFSIFDIIEGGQLPIRGGVPNLVFVETAGDEDMDRLITKVPGMETFLRCRDLPSFCRVSDMTHPNLLLVMDETRQSPRAKALILNTFEDLEGPILSQIRTQCPEIYSIGPLHEHLQAKLSAKNEKPSATRMAELSRKSVREGGSSYCNLNRLIEDIRSMSVRVHDI